MSHFPAAQGAAPVEVQGVTFVHDVITSRQIEWMSDLTFFEGWRSGFRDESRNLLSEDCLIAFAESNVHFADEAVASNEVSRWHAGYREGPSRVAGFVYCYRVVNGVASEKVERIFVDIVHADCDHAKIRGREFLTQSIEGRQREPAWAAPAGPEIQISHPPPKR